MDTGHAKGAMAAMASGQHMEGIIIIECWN
jgi:hypothetical protein